MMERRKQVAKITGIVNRGEAVGVIEALAEHGIVDAHLAVGRSDVLHDKKWLFGASERTVIDEDPIEILTFLVDPALEDAALKLVLHAGRLGIAGRGMAFSETVELLWAHELCAENRTADFTVASDIPLLSDLALVCCIAQRGEGDRMAMISLDTGTCVPAITFGQGTGVRDKMGLLRITIPAEKEVVHIVTDRHDAEGLMNLMIDVGDLDQPGKGFLYCAPLNRGIVNTKIKRGVTRHAASIEQIVSVIDELKGGTKWRRRSGTAESEDAGKAYLRDLTDLTMLCNEGRGPELVKAAMAAGAAGATIGRQRHVRPRQSPLSRLSPARECCNMIVSPEQTPAIGEALRQAGAFDDETHGQVYARPVPKAFTYIGKS
ncbi:MAG: hypothetical protein M0P04_10000 [Syntrophales bacterium]|nr:hypothetical protein [Syntrophales bacterium]MDD4338699.1 hypothetical protein [Syntrophales bacterium]HOG08145.1 hypothetical protein [Syntrophales bacterium]HPB69654.1 hypothetical protein [Syntrophales bacterium]HQN26384.1 hypothetical protein [Syntrophales bacterium]